MKNKIKINCVRDQFGTIYFDFTEIDVLDANSEYYFGEFRPEDTYIHEWKKIPSAQTTLKVIQKTYEHTGWVLYDIGLASQRLPVRIDISEREKYEDLGELSDHYCLESKTTLSEEFYEVEWNVTHDAVIQNLDKTISGNYKVGKYPLTEHNLKRDFLDELIIPEILEKERPLRLSSLDTYEIIRNYVKDHIDNRYATITSDYTFIFGVGKRLNLAKPYSYESEYKNGRKKRKKKIYVNEKTIPLFEITHTGANDNAAPYRDGKPVVPFSGNNLQDLQNNIDTFLKGLMEEINAPLEECKCCGGTGAALVQNSKD